MSLERDLSLYEFINLQSNLCLMLDINASDLKHENVLKSYYAIKQRHIRDDLLWCFDGEL